MDKTKIHKPKNVDKWDFIKILNLPSSKDTIKKMWYTQRQRTIFQNIKLLHFIT